VEPGTGLGDWSKHNKLATDSSYALSRSGKQSCCSEVNNISTSTSVFGDGRIYIHTCWGQAFPIYASPLPWRRARRQWRGLASIGICRSASPRADSFDTGLLGEQSSPKWEIPCPGRLWIPLQNLMPLALSWPKKSVTVQNDKNYSTNKRTNDH